MSTESTPEPAPAPVPEPTLLDSLQARKTVLAKIVADAQSEIASIEATLSKLPAEFHALTHSGFIAKIEAWFKQVL